MPQPVTAALVQQLDRVDALSTRLDALILKPPPPGSAAFVDKNDRLRVLAHDLAPTYLVAALDHLRAWRTLLHAGEVPMYAHMSLLRTAHESALAALWLVEPGVSADERCARGVAAQLADYKERRNVEVAMAITSAPPPAQTAVQRHAALLAVAEQRGLTKASQKGQAVLITPCLPAVELFDWFEPVHDDSNAKGSYLYRLYSGFAHAKQWVLALLGAQRITPFDEVGRAVAVAPGSDLLTVIATERTVDAVERAVAACEELHRPTG